MKKMRQLLFFKNYYWEFYNVQKEDVKDKIDYVLFLVAVRIMREYYELKREGRLK